MAIRKSRLQNEPPAKKEPIPINGLAEINSGVDAIAEALNVVMRDHRKMAGKIDGLDMAKPDGWKAIVTKRDPTTREIKEIVLRPIFDRPGTMN